MKNILLSAEFDSAEAATATVRTKYITSLNGAINEVINGVINSVFTHNDNKKKILNALIKNSIQGAVAVRQP